MQHCLDYQVRIIERRGTLGANGECLTAFLELPPIETVAKAKTYAGMLLEILRFSRNIV
jgi:hypothetical protein